MSYSYEQKIFNYKTAHENFRYDAIAGKLYRRAGTVTEDQNEYELKTQGIHGQLQCNIFGKRRLVKNIIILMNSGIWPDYGVKNADGNPFNNKLENLDVLTFAKFLELYSAFDKKDKFNHGVIYNARTRRYNVAFKWGEEIRFKSEHKCKHDAIKARNYALGFMGIF